jgi:hypothetical protein
LGKLNEAEGENKKKRTSDAVSGEIRNREY